MRRAALPLLARIGHRAAGTSKSLLCLAAREPPFPGICQRPRRSKNPGPDECGTLAAPSSRGYFSDAEAPCREREYENPPAQTPLTFRCRDRFRPGKKRPRAFARLAERFHRRCKIRRE